VPSPLPGESEDGILRIPDMTPDGAMLIERRFVPFDDLPLERPPARPPGPPGLPRGVEGDHAIDGIHRNGKGSPELGGRAADVVEGRLAVKQVPLAAH
jgi:hypothetical protein